MTYMEFLIGTNVIATGGLVVSLVTWVFFVGYIICKETRS